MSIVIRDHKGNVRPRARGMLSVFAHAEQFAYVVLHAQGNVLHLQFGTGEEPDTGTAVFSDPASLGRWIADRVRTTRGKIRGQFITRDAYNAMEAARARLAD